VNYHLWHYLIDRLIDYIAISYVDLMVVKSRDAFLESSLIPTRVPLATEKYSALIIVYTMNFKTSVREIQANFGANQAI
jgi:hypothetical protein